MHIDLPTIQQKLDSVIDDLISIHGRKILCIIEKPLDAKPEDHPISFYDIAILINTKFPELRFSKEYHISAMFEYEDKEKSIFTLEGLSLIHTQNNQQTTLLISKINGYTNLVPENPKLIH